METSIEGNGVVFNLFHYLWLYDPLTDKSPAINLPDTIIYRLGEPKFWYFSQNGRIVRKSKVNMTLQNIYDTLVRKAPVCKIVALFVSIKTDKKQGENTQKNYTFDYMTQEDLKKFIFTQDFYREG